MLMKDMMPHFELFQPTSVEDALALMDRYGEDGWVLAGGHDSLNGFKDRAKRPRAVIDLDSIDGLRGIRGWEGGLEIGVLTTLTELTVHPLIVEQFGLLAQAAGMVASPQIRNTGTLGGNLCQDTRCWYYRGGLPCYRAGGNVCYADTPVGVNREHAIFGADRCVAVTPSDTAPALVALDAEMVIQSSSGERVVRAEDFFMEPGVDITRMTVLESGDLLTRVRIPSTFAGARFYFEKVADRKTWDFALVNVAAAFRESAGRVEDARVVCGAVQCVPRRLRDVEAAVWGQAGDEATAEAAGTLAVEGATALNYNGFKIPLMESLVRRAVRG